jgi:hypothetical protein
MKRRLLCLVLAAAGCSAYRYERSTSITAPPKPANCSFDILASRPDRPYDELGVLDPQRAALGDQASFREAIRADVCRAGGDAVVAEVSSQGYYVSGTVIRYR